jgi:membrane AbrB-like protein
VIARPWLALCAGLPLAGLTGWLFTIGQVPIGWILGAMLGGAIISNILGLPAQSTNVRRVGQVLIGTAAATILTPDILQYMLTLLPAMIAAAVLANASAALLIWPFAKITGVDCTTAALSVLPAGMAEMASLAQDIGARTEVVVVVHTLRVVLVVVSIPIILQLSGTTSPAIEIVEGATYAALFACLGLGAAIAYGISRLGILNPWILMPMVVGVVLVSFGFPLMTLPHPVLIIAQICIGFALGTRFRLSDLAHLPSVTLGAVVTGCALIILMTFGVAPVMATLIDADHLSLVLGLAPGGLGEMIATSKAVGGATALVVGFQFIRSFLTNMLAPLIIVRLFDKPKR